MFCPLLSKSTGKLVRQPSGLSSGAYASGGRTRRRGGTQPTLPFSFSASPCSFLLLALHSLLPWQLPPPLIPGSLFQRFLVISLHLLLLLAACGVTSSSHAPRSAPAPAVSRTAAAALRKSTWDGCVAAASAGASPQATPSLSSPQPLQRQSRPLLSRTRRPRLRQTPCQQCWRRSCLKSPRKCQPHASCVRTPPTSTILLRIQCRVALVGRFSASVRCAL